jgi:hypothetical protein
MLLTTDTFFPISIMIKRATSPHACALISGLLISYMPFSHWRGDFRDSVSVSVTPSSIDALFFEAYKQYRGLSVWEKED